jgi:cell division protein FtsW
MLRYAPYALSVAIILLALCLVPHVGLRINGSPRWLGQRHGWSYQPSEFAKLALILFLSWWMGKNQRHARELNRGLTLPVLCALPVLLLMVLQQDYGTTAIMLAILVTILFVAGSRMLYLLPLPVIGFTGLGLYAISTPERWGRILAWWNSCIQSTSRKAARAGSSCRVSLRSGRAGCGASVSATAGRKCTGCPR